MSNAPVGDEGEAFRALRVRSIVLLGACMTLWTCAGCAPRAAPVEIRFRAVVKDAPLVLARAFEEVGATRAAVRFTDFRMFVSRLRLRAKDGRWTPLALVADGRFQDEHAALLDFGGAQGSSTDTHTRVVGLLPPGQYTELAFELGVPFEQNHQDASRARPPFDTTSMFWSWRNGYKFLRLEGEGRQPEVHKFAVHIGSTGCRGQANTPVDVPSTCAHPNRAALRLTDFDPVRNTVVVRIDRLLSGLALSGEAPDDGCESDAADPDCESVFAALGISKSVSTPVFEVGRP